MLLVIQLKFFGASDSSGGVSYTQDIVEIYYTLLEKDPQISQKSKEAVTPRTDHFDILVYWKAATRYPILALIARDIYAIPIFTVAYESVFSKGRRFISSHRNRLHPKTLGALMCAKDWLWATVKSVSEGIFLIFVILIAYTLGFFNYMSKCYDNFITLTISFTL